MDKVEELENQLKPNLTIVEGRKLNKKGNILDDEGEVLAKLVEGDAKACAGKIPNENGGMFQRTPHLVPPELHTNIIQKSSTTMETSSAKSKLSKVKLPKKP